MKLLQFLVGMLINSAVIAQAQIMGEVSEKIILWGPKYVLL